MNLIRRALLFLAAAALVATAHAQPTVAPDLPVMKLDERRQPEQFVPLPAGSRWSLPLNGAAEYRWSNVSGQGPEGLK
jgi:hypothetical protein